MSTQQELDLQARLADMERQIAELAAKVNPLYSGGMDRYIHSGYLQFDGIPMRWDPTGRQIVVGSSTSDRYFYEFLVSQLTTNPGSKYPLLATGGYVSSTAIQQDVSAYLTSGNYGRVFVFADNTPSQRGGAEAARGATVAQVFANIGETDDGHVKVKPAILFERVTSRPTGLAEGGLWAGTDDKLYFYDGASDIDITAGGGSSMGVVLDARDWATAAGYDFWFVPGSGDLVTASSATNISGLDSYGWTTTNLSFGGGSGGDFLSSADHDPSYIDFGANGDILTGPDIFGSYAHMLQAAELLGSTPTTLVIEFYAAFTTNSANESTSGLGLGAGTISIYSDGSNFVLTTTAGSDTGAAVDTAWHRFKIVVGATTEWFIDGVSQGTTTTQQDSWPMGLDVRTSTTNRIRLAWARVKYA